MNLIKTIAIARDFYDAETLLVNLMATSHLDNIILSDVELPHLVEEEVNTFPLTHFETLIEAINEHKISECEIIVFTQNKDDLLRLSNSNIELPERCSLSFVLNGIIANRFTELRLRSQKVITLDVFGEDHLRDVFGSSIALRGYDFTENEAIEFNVQRQTFKMNTLVGMAEIFVFNHPWSLNDEEYNEIFESLCENDRIKEEYTIKNHYLERSVVAQFLF